MGDFALAVRLVHVVSAALMFGVGVGAFWFLTTAMRSGDVNAIAIATRGAVRAEWVIAVPVAVLQPLSGVLLMDALSYSFSSRWFMAVVAFYIVAGIAWVWLVKAEYRLRDLSASAAGSALPADFNRLLVRWRALALTSFGGVLVLFGLMVFRPGV